MSKTTEYILAQQELDNDLLAMQNELSRLSDMWGHIDRSPDIDKDKEYIKHSEKLLKEEAF